VWLARVKWLAVSLLLLGYWALAVASVQNKSTTYDEVGHLTAGCAYWQYNDYRLQPENGNLPQRWCAAPIVLSGRARLPSTADPDWKDSNVWGLGVRFFHQLGNPLNEMLLLGRSASALLGCGVALLVWLWSRALWGELGGLLSLAVCVLCPTMLAHGPLMTSDMCFTLFLLGSTAGIWGVLHKVTALRLAGCAVLLAGLFLSKFSAAVILVVALILVVIRLLRRQPLPICWAGRQWQVQSRWRQLLVLALAVGVCTAITFAFVWLAYGLRYSAFQTAQLPPGQFFKYGSLEGMPRPLLPPSTDRALTALDGAHVLPQSFLYGAAYVVVHRERWAFFRGQYSDQGWIGYFPFCFLVKTPWPLFALLALAAVLPLGLRRKPPQSPGPSPAAPAPAPVWYRTAPLWTLWGIYWAGALLTTLNIGHRHLLPTYPPLYIAAGAAAGWLAVAPRLGRLLLALVLAWSVAEAALAFPHYLAYFNPLLPVDRAYQALVDSNLDWGQDLPSLRDWLNREQSREGPRPVYLDYFGKGDPGYYGITCTPLPPRPDNDQSFSYKPGIYCISATSLQAVYWPEARHWTATRERAYIGTADLLERLRTGRPIPRDLADLAQPDSPRRKQLLRQYVLLQYMRLLGYLRQRRPNDNVGHSILVFRLSADDLREALTGPPPELHRPDGPAQHNGPAPGGDPFGGR
jgi:hypothetical protein